MDIEKKKRLASAALGAVAGLWLAALPALADVLTEENVCDSVCSSAKPGVQAAWNNLAYTKPDAAMADRALAADEALRADYADTAGTAAGMAAPPRRLAIPAVAEAVAASAGWDWWRCWGSGGCVLVAWRATSYNSR